jgi:cellulose biosynthesis protein BcsQ
MSRHPVNLGALFDDKAPVIPAAPAEPESGTSGLFDGGDFTDGALGAAPRRPRLWGRRRAADLAARELAADLAAMAAHWGNVKTYMVANEKGRGGKSPLAILLAGAFGNHSDNRACLIDANPGGNAHMRVERAADGAMRIDDLAAVASEAVQKYPNGCPSPWISQYLSWQPSGKYSALLGSGPTVRLPDGTYELNRPGPSRREFFDIYTLLGHKYPILGIDTGNVITDDVWQAAAAVSDCLVIPVTWELDACEGAVNVLATLERTGGPRGRDLSHHAIVVETGAPIAAGDEQVLAQRRRDYSAPFKRWNLEVCSLPFDPKIAENSHIVWSDLAAGTRRAAVALAAKIAARFSLNDAARTAAGPGPLP